MNAETLEALKGSIEHWERLVDFENNPFEEPFSDQCALCAMFFGPCEKPDDREGNERCRGCPVFLKTGKILCRKTPYPNAALFFNYRFRDGATFKRHAEMELEFLKSLLPEDDK